MAARLRVVQAAWREDPSRSSSLTSSLRVPRRGGAFFRGAMNALLALTLVQVGSAIVGAIGSLRGLETRHAVPAAPLLLTALAFGGTGAVLARAGRRDQRALFLAGFFLCVASAPSLRFIAFAPAVLPYLPVRLLTALLPEAFLPLFLWLFAREFPRVVRLDRWAGLVTGGVRASGVVGTVLFAANAILRLVSAPALRTAGLGWLELLGRHPTGLYWLLLSALCLPVPAVAWLRSRLANAEERRRVRFFLFGLGVGVVPLFTEVLLEALSPAFSRLMDQPHLRSPTSVMYLALLLTVPVSTTYAVLAHRLLDVRLILRRAARLALTRRSLLLLGAMPSLLLLLHLVRARDRPLGLILAEKTGGALLGGAVLGWFLIALRRGIEHRLAPRLMGQVHEPELVLASFGSDARNARTLAELSDAVRDRLAELVSAESTHLLLYDGPLQSYRPAERGLRALPANSALARLLAASPAPLVLAEEQRGSFLPWLVEEDRQWIADADAHLAIAIPGAESQASALLILGASLDGSRYGRRQQQALTAFAGTASLAIERLAGLVSAAPDASAMEREAGECRACGRLGEQAAEACPCGGTFTSAAIPLELGGKFRLQRVLGRGGMGVVYLADDLALSRKVALKTLPQLRADALLRLRREARSMAGFLHPNLALIFGLETWRGVPVLVVEYLAGGTLAERLGTGREPKEVLRWGLDLAAAIDAMHGQGLLHRDIKPSNIGLTADGVPKLLDFGLAQLTAEVRVGLRPPDEAALTLADSRLRMTLTGHVVGTPLYLPPEAFAGAEPSPLNDLWGLHLVLWEALAGSHPCAGLALAPALRRIAAGEVPDIRRLRPDCPTPVAELLLHGLDPNPRRRLSSARAVREAIAETLAVLS